LTRAVAARAARPDVSFDTRRCGGVSFGTPTPAGAPAASEKWIACNPFLRYTVRMSKLLAVGDQLPDVTLSGPGGKPVRLRDLVKAKGLVVYFYPKDDTIGCTVESCTFRDQYEDFVSAGADVVGISADPPESHQRFASKHRLPFTLLSDETGAGRAAFGVNKTFGLMPGRVTFVFDGAGVVRHVFESQVRVKAHVEHALEIVRGLVDLSRSA
jgi:peroxiredoxin Q/BCP